MARTTIHPAARLCSARGQSTAFVASMLFVMVLFVSVVANVGQAVNRRIALQTIADTGAYTGASVMAVGYNQLAYWNTWMQRTWAAFTASGISPLWYAIIPRVVPYPLYTCETVKSVEGAHNGVMRVLKVAYTAINVGYAFLATSEARRVSEYNASDLFPTDYRSIRYAESDLPEIMAGHNFGQIAPSQDVPNGSEPKALPDWLEPLIINSRTASTYLCAHPGPFGIPIPDVQSGNYEVWRRKVPNRVDSFVWVATAPASKALMFDRLFGGDVIPAMKAVAVAKPIGGVIEEGETTYKTKMMPVATVMTLNRIFGGILPDFLETWTTDQAGAIRDSEYDRGFRIVTH